MSEDSERGQPTLVRAGCPNDAFQRARLRSASAPLPSIVAERSTASREPGNAAQTPPSTRSDAQALASAPQELLTDGDVSDPFDREPPPGEEPFGRANAIDHMVSIGPRDRLWAGGVASLSDVDLIAVLLGTGTSGRSATALAIDLIERLGGLRGLAGAHPAEVARINGVGGAKAARLLAATEVGRRVAGRPWRRGDAFLGAKQIYEHFAPSLRDERREFFVVAFLDARHRLIGEEVISTGSLVASIVHPREVFRPAVRHAAAGIIVAHNHPSGDPTPSAEDWAVTERLRRTGETLGIELIDHVVIGDGAWASLREECAIKEKEGEVGWRE